jgi:RsiW-degrading membrane proteinase PrsW (M82 family)
VLATLRWLLFTGVPAGLFAVLVHRTDKNREPPWLVAVTFALAAAAGVAAHYLTGEAHRLTGLDVRVSVAGERGALVFLFLVVAPLREAGKVAAVWPAFRSRHFDEPYDGIVYATAAALGFAVAEDYFILRAHPTGGIWIARTLVALPAHVFFACLWGYGLGRSKHWGRGVQVFPLTFLAAIVLHGLYGHFVYGRGPGALLAVTPMLAGMGIVTWLLGRNLVELGPRRSPASLPPPSSRFSITGPPPSLSVVRMALSRAEEPVKLRWIVFGALITIGSMIVGVATGVFAANALHIDLSQVDEHDVKAAAPVLFLAFGLLASFPMSGWLIARAAAVRTLLEPALATVLALGVTVVCLGFAAPVAVVFALALSPVAWLLSCFGAWVGRVA